MGEAFFHLPGNYVKTEPPKRPVQVEVDFYIDEVMDVDDISNVIMRTVGF